MHQLCFPYMLNYPALHSLSERELAAAHMQGTRLKIVSTIKNLYHASVLMN